ncbi:MAG: bifunctional 4-hydroxy-2-oxoglutarate aldolase/2-dehydro-3-deoxy-phosphogluconate aldolase [Bacteroidetes bacterium]|nr:bifunctional 4-hydroxy-2-oxoglutarate aldolase/2-dehydro-3-deoxy-phosphogluconate aldolase [Bacteroidota bacterium]
MKNEFKADKFDEMPVIGILRNVPLPDIEAILPFYIKAGFTNLEVTMNSNGAEETIRHLSENYPSLNIGAGTVCDKNDLKRAVKAGASFIVTPVVDEKVIKKCVKWGIPIFPGAFSPLEIYTASKYGATGVKVFPANHLGPSYIKDVLAPFQYLKLYPTGGVNLENISAYFKAGAKGLGMGGTLFLASLLETKDYENLGLHFEKVALAVNNAKSR